MGSIQNSYILCVLGINFLGNKLEKSSKFLSPPQADGLLRNFASLEQILLKLGTHVANYGVFQLE